MASARPLSLLFGVCTVLLMGVTACKKDTPSGANAPLRVAFFPNITHAQALVANSEGLFGSQPGMGHVEVRQFNAGPAAMEALVAGSVDVAYVGPGPAINTYLKAGKELRIIAGAVNGGAVLVVKNVKTAAELKGRKLATPQLGNTQDIALRTWLKGQGLSIAKDAGGDVQVIPISNPDILAQYLQGAIEGAWVPEPWGARMLAEGGGHILVDERDLWPDKRFPTTVVVTTKKVLETQRPRIAALLRIHVALTERWRADPAAFATSVNAAFGQLTRKPLPTPVLQDAFSRLEPSLDPVPAALKTSAEHAKSLGFIPGDDLAGLVDLSVLDEVRGGGAKPN
ncbi:MULTISPECIES: ABC transporter substrate-binding protein [unclassified Corallococcus]|uniref:ABC transporter substrate-binding protein n=1 Tax=unclassified Corallococcus TaxID=2685029 RepID=UPI001A8DCE42|nr:MULTISPECIES: ABC transporter substrate-binding protein [unclassified Corallococcus]MBN9681366.1 ABC transporter substrate-binding protein [Corallococcus sp. NCSPR001]WAS87053.1 ABC transporter substrate-binding protein [Corallococcus sp. NCRR]